MTLTTATPTRPHRMSGAGPGRDRSPIARRARLTAAVAAAFWFGAAAADPDPQRGELLYQNHCTGCHESTVHVRAASKAKTLGELRGWIARWEKTLDLDWGEDEFADVLSYLNRRHYRYDE